jgi:hypothetical protein
MTQHWMDGRRPLFRTPKCTTGLADYLAARRGKLVEQVASCADHGRVRDGGEGGEGSRAR